MPVSHFPDDLVTTGLLLALLMVLVVSGVGVWWALRKENQEPTSFTRGGDLAWWALLPAEEQEDIDNAALDEAERADIDAAADAQESAEFLAYRAQFNALYHP